MLTARKLFVEFCPSIMNADVPSSSLREPSLTATAVPCRIAWAMVTPSSSHEGHLIAHLVSDDRVVREVRKVVSEAGRGGALGPVTITFARVGLTNKETVARKYVSGGIASIAKGVGRWYHA